MAASDDAWRRRVARSAETYLLYRPRRHLWLKPSEPLVCPNGHKIKHPNTGLIEHEAFICSHREPGPTNAMGGHSPSGECGLRVYVMQFPRGLKFVAEVTVEEMLYMKRNAMSVEEVISYLRGQSA